MRSEAFRKEGHEMFEQLSLMFAAHYNEENLKGSSSIETPFTIARM
jgi:hypothetical protein